MAPPTTYTPPHVQLGKLMVLARRRGLSFEEFWTEAVRPGERVVMANHPEPPAGAVRWPTDWHDRETWRAAILGSEEGWRRSYERAAPTQQEAALAHLAPGLGALDEVARERAEEEAGGVEPAIAA